LFTHSGTGSNVLGYPELDGYSERTSADNLRRVLEIMKPSVKDLASLFEVSRQTIYNWLNGDEPRAEQAARLRALATVADIVAAENIADPSRLLKRAGVGGASLWDIVKEGGDVEEFARQLVQVGHVEHSKMAKLNEKFANRRRGDDAGELTPRLDETP
jgi:transcriptional regulator with XRE-family HTH domain